MFSRIRQWAEELGQRPILLYAVLLVATFGTYISVQHFQFLLYDDRGYVTENPHVNSGLSMANVTWAFSEFAEGNWHPVTWISHMLDCQLFGLNPGPHHLVNVLLHAINALLLFYLLQRLTGAVWRSLLVAALFALHPMNVETVAWVAERKSLLCTLFSFLTMLAYAWYSERESVQRYAAVLAGLALALLSKPMAVSLPLVLMLMDYWPLDRQSGLSFRERCKALLPEKIPLLLASVLASMVTVLAQRPSVKLFLLPGPLPLPYRLGNAVVSYMLYIGKLFWPTNQAILYPHPGRALPIWQVVLAVVLLSAVTVLVIQVQRRARFLVMGWLLFLVTLVPVIGIVQVGCQGMADRYTYFPYLGLFIMLSWGLGEIVEWRPAAAVPSGVLACAALAVLGCCTTHYLPYFQDGVQLFTRASQVYARPHPYIEEFLAEELMRNGRFEDAFEHFQRSCKAYEQYDICHMNLAEVYYSKYDMPDALEQYEDAAAVTDDKELKAHAYTLAGGILLDEKKFPQAEQAVEGALESEPFDPEALQLRSRLREEEYEEGEAGSSARTE